VGSLMKSCYLVVLAGALVFSLMLGTANADLIGLDLGLPDIFSDTTGKYSYAASTDLFTSTATAVTITFDGVNLVTIANGIYNVSFQVDSSGNFSGGVSGDDLGISGDFTYASKDYSGLLVAGEVTNFGWGTLSSYAIFDFTFEFTHGALSSFYAANNNQGGDILTSESNSFAGDWTVNHGGSAKHDTAPIPEASTLLLLGGGLSGLLFFARKKRLIKF